MKNSSIKKYLLLFMFFVGLFFAHSDSLFAGTLDKELFEKDKLIDSNYIESIEFLDNKTPVNAIGVIDASVEKNSSILAWYTDSDQNGLYEVYIGSYSAIYFPEDSSFLFSLTNKLKSITFDNIDTTNVKDMSEMFYGGLTSLDLSLFNTSNVTNMSYMFNLESLSSLDLSNFDTTNVKNMSHMFYECTNITSLDLSNFVTTSVTNMTGMFYGMSSLNDLNISSFNTGNVIDMSYMFSGCKSMETYTLSNFNTKKVTNMSNMFEYNESLESINLSSFNTLNVKNLSYFFSECKSLETINISSFDTSNVSTFMYMFGNCTSIVTLDLSNFDLTSAENISFMFSYCENLINVDLSSFDTKNVIDMNAMFEYCDKLTLLDLTTFDTSSATSFLDMFPDVVISIKVSDKWDIPFDGGIWINLSGEKYLGLDIPESVNDTYTRVAIYWAVDNGVLTISNDDLSSYAINGKISATGAPFHNVALSEMPWGDYKEDITSVKVGTSNSDIIKTVTMKNWFYNLTNVTSFDFTYIDTSSVTNMQFLFRNCEALETLDLSNFNTSNVSTMQEMFAGDKKLLHIDISNFNSSNLRNLDNVFTNSYIYEVKLGNNLNISLSEGTWRDSITKQEYNFSDIPTNKTATYYKVQVYYGIKDNVLKLSGIPLESGYDINGWTPVSGAYPDWNTYYNNITSISIGAEDDTVRPTFSIREWFKDYKGSTLDLTYLDTSNVVDFYNAFNGASNIESLDLSRFNTYAAKYMNGMFANCTKLKTLDLSNFDTSKVTKYDYMFFKDTALENIIMKNFVMKSDASTTAMFYKDDKLSLNLEVGFSYATLKITDITKKEKTGSLGTGNYIISEYDGDKTYTQVCVRGDITGDGIINISDVAKLYQYHMGKIEMKQVFINASDVTGNNKIDISDVAKLYQYHMGKIENL